MEGHCGGETADDIAQCVHECDVLHDEGLDGQGVDARTYLQDDPDGVPDDKHGKGARRFPNYRRDAVPF